MSNDYPRFYRSRSDRMIAGICGGLGDYFNIDPTLIRLGFVFLALIGFAGAAALAYLVMLIVVPESPILGSVVEPSAVVDAAPATADSAGEAE